MIRRAVVLALSTVITLSSTAAWAKPKREVPAEARAHAKKAQEHFKAKRYAEAVAEYQAAYAIIPNPGLLFNIARAYHQQERRTEALDYYRRYLKDVPTGPESDEARDYVAALTREMAAAEPPTAVAPAPSAAEPAAVEPPAPAPIAAARPASEPPSAAGPTTVTLTGEAPRRAPWLAGPKLGLHAATMDYKDDTNNSSTRFGVVAGGFVAYMPAEWLAIQLELLYAQKGSVPDDNSPLDLHYLEVPLLAKPTYRGFFAEVGPYLAVALAADTYFDDERKDLDAGLIFGGGYTWTFGSGRLVFEARYELGLISIKEMADYRTRTVSFAVGYSFL